LRFVAESPPYTVFRNGYQLIHIIEIVSAKPNRGRGELVRIRQQILELSAEFVKLPQLVKFPYLAMVKFRLQICVSAL